jgi:hypothetical protein
MRLRNKVKVALAAAGISLAAATARGQQAVALVDLPDAPLPQPTVAVNEPQHHLDDQGPKYTPCPNQDSNLVPEDCSAKEPRSEKLERFANSKSALELTPGQKFRLAERNVSDPFNLASIAFFSALDVATDANGPYGPGLKGFGRDFGTTLTEDINGQFWSTFVVASVAHEDPHYHRMPQASIKRRILHCFDAVAIAQSDSGRPMPNYDNIVGSSISAAINNLYVPYPSTNVPSTVDRVLAGLAFDPVGNAVTEFLPDVARRVNVRVVFVQKVMNRIYESETGGAQLQ